MHEMSIALDISEILDEEMGKHPGRRLAGVTITVGELSGIETESLRFALEAAFAEQDREEVKLDIRKAPLKALCEECGCEFEPQASDFRCRKCTSGKIEITSGQSLTIETITLQ